MTENERIRYLRKEVLKLTLDKFSKALGVSRSAISDIESGRNALSNQMVMLIRKVYRVSEEWLRNGTGEMLVKEDANERVANVTATLMEEDPESEKLELTEMLMNMDKADVHRLRLIAEILASKKG